MGDTHWVQYGNQTFQYDKMVTLPRFPIPRHATTVGTHPAGSSWARIPVPGCKLCDQSVCGAPLLPNMSETFKPGGIYGPGAPHRGLDPWTRAVSRLLRPRPPSPPQSTPCVLGQTRRSTAASRGTASSSAHRAAPA